MFLLLSLLLSLSCATKTLVLVRDLVDKTTYSQFLRNLKNQGHDLTFKVASDSSIALQNYGEYNYDNVILLSPNSKKFGDLGTKSFMQYVDSGRNLMLLASGSPSKLFKNIAANLGVEIRSQYVKDHFCVNELVLDSKNDTYITTKVVGGGLPTPSLPIAYRGLSFTMKEKTQLGYHLLMPESTGYSEFGSSSELGLVTAIQMRNNARITFVGSADLLSNEFSMMDVMVNGRQSKTGNGEFVRNMVSWTFQELGKLRARNVKHYLLDGSGPENPTRYTVKEMVRYEVVIEEFDRATQSWKPHVADDVEFNLLRLDPFIRTVLNTDGKGLYFLEFMLPDIFGVFKLIVDYKRVGWSYIYEEMEASVRPLRHDQHARFLTSAFPYYGAIMSTICGFVIFGFLFLHTERDDVKEKDD